MGIPVYFEWFSASDVDLSSLVHKSVYAVKSVAWRPELKPGADEEKVSRLKESFVLTDTEKKFALGIELFNMKECSPSYPATVSALGAVAGTLLAHKMDKT